MSSSLLSEESPVKLDQRHQIVFSIGQQKLFGMLHLPFTGLPAPAILICHGLGSNKIGRYRLYVTLAEQLAQRGIAVLRFDARGCGDSEGSFDKVTLQSQIDDALAATAFLKSHPQIDAQRLGIMGRSFGGLVAVFCARRSASFRSLALWSAVFDGEPWRPLWQQFSKGSLSQEQCEAYLNHNGQQVNPKLFYELFEVDMVSELAALDALPFLHIHGAQDQRVTIAHADQYARCRAASRAPSHFIRLPNGDHEISDRRERAEALEATIDWFRQTL